MALIDTIGEDFDQAVRIKGNNLFQRGAVDVVRLTHRSVAAAVQGERRFIVEIDWDGGYFDYECSCDDFQIKGQACKHIWATLLEAQARNRLPKEEMIESTGPSAPQVTAGAAEESIALDVPLANGSGVMRSSKPPIWKHRLATLRTQMSYRRQAAPEPWPSNREIIYVVDLPATLEGRGVQIDLMNRGKRRDGQWERLKTVKRLRRNQLATFPDPLDRQILQMLAGTETSEYGWGYGAWEEREIPRRYRLSEGSFDNILRLMCHTTRCRLRHHPQETNPPPLAWDDAGIWQFVVSLKRDASGVWKVDGFFRRGEDRLEINEPELLVSGGLIFAHGKVAPLNDGGAFELIGLLRRDEKLAARSGQERELLAELLTLPRLPEFELPEALGIAQLRPPPRPKLKIRRPGKDQFPQPDALRGEMWFDYDGQTIAADQPNSAIFLAEQGKLIHRDLAAERAAAGRLRGLGFRQQFDLALRAPSLMILPRALPAAVRALAQEGWRIEAEGKLYRNPGPLNIEVRSGIDWFEVHAVVDFDGKHIALPRLLSALRRGENTVALDDGTIGILPEDWLNKYGLLAGMGEEQSDHLRFKKSQAGLLDALLASRPEVVVDVAFSAAREALRNFDGIGPQEPPAGFIGELRPYQKEGLGWMDFLRRFSFGGCLADDMGLGKTVQVLALLEARRQADMGTSLVVVPRSLIFNWKAEAARFAPQIRILDHTGPFRDKTAAAFSQYDLVLTTYGTCRNDAVFLKDFTFDYLILDEAQAIKNAGSESAKAVRLLNGRHRLALSGTPVQNHLGELWSLFEFLNPGMLGASGALSAAGGAKNLDAETAQALGRALRPFILRRTKDQVARDLPERLEQTIYCDLDPAQRKQYDELRDHYRQALWTKIAQDGLAKSKIMVLEALLRLRQAACHPGLIDKTRTAERSAKLDTLISRLNEVHEEGHKALVFSQFTSLLAIVKQRLDTEKVPYEYLDGKTRDRQERVERFQNDPECKLFLVSLKAGGLGLNLTAAEYVFLLDPWWNPAVEAQAIDRAHRIGQTRRVFAYRLITRDTVEQKVLDLQKTKRDLADAVITADNRTLATLKKEDLELLLS
ncbi:MAG: DEAD/DEAH box helicase [Tepidisphaeraceae bacterium]|jgi:superfamily II DNA or RNA helicase